jgi:hypothetical protein
MPSMFKRPGRSKLKREQRQRAAKRLELEQQIEELDKLLELFK